MYQNFAQEVENTARAVVNDIHTAMPGKITAFDPKKGVAAVQPKGKYLTAEGASLEYPVISDVPVAFPYCQSSDVGMTFPVKPGDNCLIIVSEVELDEWRSGAESEAPLRYDLTSAMAIPDLMLGGSDAMRKATELDAVVIKAKQAEIVVSDGLVSVTADVTIQGAVTINGDFTTKGGVVRLN